MFLEKSRTEKDGIQSINPSINAFVPEQKPESSDRIGDVAETKDRNGKVRPIFLMYEI